MARRNRVNQGPLVIMILLILAAWLFWQSGATSLLSPAGMLLLLMLVLVLNSFLRKRSRPKPANKAVASNPYGPRPTPRRLERGKTALRSRTSRAVKPETWPYDGSYCVYCGLKKRGEESLCRRCHQPIDYSA